MGYVLFLLKREGIMGLYFPEKSPLFEDNVLSLEVKYIFFGVFLG